MLAILAVFFLILHAIVLWYWKINEAIQLLKSIDQKLGKSPVVLPPGS
jgi:hypothetical protein